MPGIQVQPCCCGSTSPVIYSTDGAYILSSPKSDYHNPPATTIGSTTIATAATWGVSGAGATFRGVAVDASYGKLFTTFTDGGTAITYLLACNLDGSSPVILIDGSTLDPGNMLVSPVPADAGLNITGVITDHANHNLYFSGFYNTYNYGGSFAAANPGFWRCTYSGGGLTNIVLLGTNGATDYYPRGMAVDPAQSLFFYGHRELPGDDSIFSCDLSGGSQTNILSHADFGDPSDFGALACDPVNQLLWFCSGFQAGFCNYNGTGASTPATTIGADGPFILAIDSAASEIYIGGAGGNTATIYDGSTQWTGPTPGQNGIAVP